MSTLPLLLAFLAILSLGACNASGPVQNLTPTAQKDPCLLLVEDKEKLRKIGDQYFADSDALRKCHSDNQVLDVFGFDVCKNKKENMDRTKQIFDLEISYINNVDHLCNAQNNEFKH
jgi:hypothetical protein